MEANKEGEWESGQPFGADGTPTACPTPVATAPEAAPAPAGPARAEGPKTFTQDDVNEIVRKRLYREREARGQMFGETGRMAEELALREQEVRQREWKIEAKERLTGLGMPAEAAELLRYDSEAGFEESFEAMRALLGPRMQAAVQAVFRDSGSIPPKSAETPPPADPVKKAFLRQK